MNSLNYNRELIEKCKAHNRVAQSRLYHSYSKAMFNICVRMLNNRLDAEDVLQKSFTDVFRNIHTFNYKATPGAWIKRIVINNCINHLKRNRIQWVDQDVSTYSDSLSTETRDEYCDVSSILNAISQLSDGYRSIFTMYAIEGLDHKEIAEYLDISESTSKSQYHRAKQKIKQIITQHG